MWENCNKFCDFLFIVLIWYNIFFFILKDEKLYFICFVCVFFLVVLGDENGVKEIKFEIIFLFMGIVMFVECLYLGMSFWVFLECLSWMVFGMYYFFFLVMLIGEYCGVLVRYVWGNIN